MAGTPEFTLLPLQSGQAVRVTRENLTTGEEVSWDFAIEAHEMAHLLKQWRGRSQHIQDVFSFLDEDAREFLISGVRPGEWDQVMGEERSGELQPLPQELAF